MTEDIIPMSYTEFLLGMLQAQHNKRYPKQRCECENVYVMAALHFEAHLKEEDK